MKDSQKDLIHLDLQVATLTCFLVGLEFFIKIRQQNLLWHFYWGMKVY